ncbi:MAG: TonB-dependent receptor [Candidatus Methylophosphatis roskildensis]
MKARQPRHKQRNEPDQPANCHAERGSRSDTERAVTPLLPLGAMLCGIALLPNAALGQSPDKDAREATLPTINVKDAREAGNNGYQGGTTNVGKTKQLPKDIPQAITIVPEALILDTNSDTLKSALRNVAGLTYNAGEGGRIGDNFNLRGFYTFGDLYLDGIRDVAQYNRETFYVDQIDVLRGSAAMLFGRGQAGGVINQVLKQPILIDKTRVSATVGTQEYGRGTVDINKVIGENAAVRVNAMYTDAGSTRDVVESDRRGILPSVSWGIGTRNEFNLSYLYLDTHNIPDFGIPFFDKRPVSVPASRFYGTTSDYEDNITNIATATYTHRFSPISEIRTVLRAADYERDLWVSVPRLAAGATAASVADGSAVLNRNRSARGSEEHTITSQTDFTTKFATGSLKHEALAGVELLRERAGRWNYTTSAGSAPPTTLGNPDNSPGLPVGYGGQIRSGVVTYEGDSVGLYAQDTVEFIPGWKLLGGVRKDKLKADYSNGANIDFREWSWRAGLMYQPYDTHSYYVGYSDSFNPTADLYQLTAAQTDNPAERSRTAEIGAKWELMDGDLSLRTALYRAEKMYERNTDLEQANVALLSKKRHTDGIELEAAGRITGRWEVFGGLALMKAEIDEQVEGTLLGSFAQVSGGNYAAGQAANADRLVYQGRGNTQSIGMRPRNAPAYTFNLWSTYKVTESWKIGLGVEGKGNRQAFGLGNCDSAAQNATTGLWTYNACTAPTANIAPHYARWDAMVAYEQPKYTIRLNILNLTDKYYYDSLYENGAHVVPGTVRAFQVTMDYKF